MKRFDFSMKLIVLAVCAAIAVNLFYTPKTDIVSAEDTEMRGIWVASVGNLDYPQSPTADAWQLRVQMDEVLDNCQDMGFNTVFLQVRPSGDALYKSDIFPWSRYLTGIQGTAPSDGFDPLEYAVNEAHKRGMQLHAWINPYRVTNSSNDNGKLAANNPAVLRPDLVLTDSSGKMYLNPGEADSIDIILEGIREIVRNYDVDGIHMDDYFYPYPIAGSEFPDENSYARYGNGMDRGDWRRENVNALIKELHKIIKSRKPWVRFGISPFGIYRNQKSDPDGSATNGLQNYDQLYADVLLWTRNGWVDYMLPQLYWEIGHQAACVETLIYWWNNHANGRHLYIGQDVARTMNATDVNPIYTQLNHKMQLSRYLDHVGGNCFWPGYSLLENYKGIADDLKGYYHAVPSLIPAYTFIDSKAPDEVKGLKAKWTPEGYELQWKRKKTNDEMQKQIYFCVYRFAPSEDICLCDASHLVAITRDTKFLLPYKHGTRQYVYVVTAVDRMHNESKGKIKKVKL